MFEVGNGCHVHLLQAIGRKIVGFEMFSAGGFSRDAHYWVQGLCRRKPFRKTCSLDVLDHLPPALIAIAGHFGEVQPGFLQLLLTQTRVKCTSLDLSRCVVYSDIRCKAIRAASKKTRAEW